MKKTTICLLLAFLAARFTVVQAQGVQVLWDSFYYAVGNEQLNDLVLLPDGRLAGAGELHQKDKPKAGLFVLIDAETGRLTRRYFKSLGNQVLKSVAESSDGSFYLVGQVEVSDDRQGWILRLDENGQELLSQKVGENGSSDRLEKVVWLDNGTALAAGFSEQIQKGSLWLLSLNGKKNEYKDAIGSGYIGSLVGMQQDAQGRIWLAGNLSSSAKKGGAWVMQVDQNAISRLEETIGGKNFESIHNMSLSEDGVVMLAGQISASANQETDAWVVEYDAGSQIPITSKNFQYEGDDYAKAILKTPGHQRWLALRDGRGGASIAVWGNDGIEEIALRLSNSASFKAIRLMKTWQNTYIIAGIAKDPRGKRDGIRVICFKNGETLAAKAISPVQIKCDSPTLVDADPDGYLSPNERASINFRLNNIGETDVKEGRILLIKEQVVDGLTIVRESQFLPYLTAKGSPKNCSIPIKGESGLRAGTSKFRIVVETGGKQVLDIPFSLKSIETKQTLTGQRAQILVQSPRILSGAERRISVTDNSYKIKATITSTRQLKTEDTKIHVGSTIQEDQKSPPVLEALGMEGGLFIYEYSATVSLSENSNVVRLSLDDYVTDSIVFEVSDAHPDLHILAIGPSYADLKYTSKDVRDLAQAFAAQSEKGFFGQVFMDTLISPKRTTKTQVDIAFNTLLRRYLSNDLPNRIKPNDYIFVIYSGHGIKIDNRFFLVPTDYDPDAQIATTLDYKDILEKYLNKIQCKKVLFIDACLSGSAKSTMADKTLVEALNEANSSNPGLVCFTSCSENELSFEDESWENGAFTEALLEAIQGKALDLVPRKDDKAAPVSAGTLNDFLRKRVPELVAKKSGGSLQTPTLKLNDLKETLTIFAIPSK